VRRIGLSPRSDAVALTRVGCCGAGKGKNSVLKLSCGTMGVQTFKPTGEHGAPPPFAFKHIANENVCGAAAVKSYPYKELAEWVQGATMIMHLKKSEKKEMISCA